MGFGSTEYTFHRLAFVFVIMTLNLIILSHSQVV